MISQCGERQSVFDLFPVLKGDPLHEAPELFTEAVADTEGLWLVPERVETNLVGIEVDGERLGSARDVAGRLKEQGVLLAPLGDQVLRACTHLDVSKADCERAAAAIRSLAAAP